ncbi:hypothetical protein [Rhizobium phage RHph_N46]|nr:hypothetical protein [Rhizobium phage RHph_N46]
MSAVLAEELQTVYRELNKMREERDALKAKLNEVQKAHPVGWRYTSRDNPMLMSISMEAPTQMKMSQFQVDPVYTYPTAMLLPEQVRTWQHVKSGGLYNIVGTFQIESTNRPGFLYRAQKDQTVWGRDQEEFLDGRFQRLENVLTGNFTTGREN